LEKGSYLGGLLMITNKMINGKVDFSDKIRYWDGFGANYVETSQTPSYEQYAQDYGGFGILNKEAREEILELIFGENGLKPGLIKMFLDPFHQEEESKISSYKIEEDYYNHQKTTKWMRYFVKKGMSMSQNRGDNLKIFTSLYGPPGWMTKQRFIRGRDLDPEYKLECAKYIAAWAKYLTEKESLPVKCVALHNEGEDYYRWPENGKFPNWEEGHDYNMFWSPEQVAELIPVLREVLDKNEMKNIKVAPGETTNWTRFHEWGYAEAIANNKKAMDSLGLISSHGFLSSSAGRWSSDPRSAGIDILREKNPELKAWTTSISWKDMDVDFLFDYFHNIYSVKVNGIIPWACIQHSGRWVGGDPNPGTAIRVYNDGSYSIEPGYYYYKQLCRAGQPGMAVARIRTTDTQIGLIAFSANGTDNSNSLVVLNRDDTTKNVEIKVEGTEEGLFNAYRTSQNEEENYSEIGEYNLTNSKLIYDAPPRSATTFYNVNNSEGIL